MDGWGPAERAAFEAGARVVFRDARGRAVSTSEGTAGSWFEELGAVAPDDRVEVNRCWRRSLDRPGETFDCEVVSERDGTARRVRMEFVNLLDHPEVEAVMIAIRDRGPAERPVRSPSTGPAVAHVRVPRWLRQRLDELGRIIETEGSVDELFGVPAAELVGEPVLDWIHPDDHAAALGAWLEVLERPDEVRTIRQRLVRSDGVTHWIESTVRNRLDAEGDRAMVSTSVEITEQVQAVAALHESEAEFRFLAEEFPSPVFRADHTGRVTYANAEWRRRLGADDLARIVASDDLAAIAAFWTQVVGAPDVAHVSPMFVQAGTDQWWRSRVRAQAGDGDEPPTLIGVLENVTEDRRHHEDLRALTRADPLTGLANRRALEEELEAALVVGPVGVLFCDLDDFKSVNDRFGHDRGDLVLEQVARRLARLVRPGDLVARYGGDEFVVLAPGVRLDLDLAGLVDRVHRALSEPLPVGSERLVVRASVGSVRSRDGETASDVLRRADQAMYVDKLRSTG